MDGSEDGWEWGWIDRWLDHLAAPKVQSRTNGQQNTTFEISLLKFIQQSHPKYWIKSGAECRNLKIMTTSTCLFITYCSRSVLGRVKSSQNVRVGRTETGTSVDVWSRRRFTRRQKSGWRCSGRRSDRRRWRRLTSDFHVASRLVWTTSSSWVTISRDVNIHDPVGSSHRLVSTNAGLGYCNAFNYEWQAVETRHAIGRNRWWRRWWRGGWRQEKWWTSWMVVRIRGLACVPLSL